MKAIQLADKDDKTSLTLTEVPDPVLTDGEILVEVHAAGVNRGDLLQAAGFYPPPKGASEIIGLECAGVVIDSNGTDVAEGTEVCCLLAGGAYAEKVAVPAEHVLALPEGYSFTDAAAIMEVACTVFSNLVMLAGMKQGDTVVIHGGAGGIGSFAIQLAAQMGCHVITTCGSEDKEEFCRRLGADETINYHEQDFAEVATNKADVILDIMGAKYLDKNISALAPDGRIVIIGMQGGVKGELNIGKLLAKRGTIITSALRSRPKQDKADIVRATYSAIWPHLADGSIVHQTSQVFDLADAARAHALMASGDNTGKIVLRVK
ncbi:NAD(P)H-quinone oxidoreductase [Corynebacterium mendelii]|uniref:NAD(P)H-quinone oxidoreductase n=1 Tax=Corynebacterium mendelii TaxID=2765362 RepID=A0A939DYR1_9CORY|nr:NAD(P)H-quinone oxidoreductase [Corynebacterium mendelii]MBN9643704.1 NAD(P)H-quinone oxidoreductase [Corynebacterium mendelii]